MLSPFYSTHQRLPPPLRWPPHPPRLLLLTSSRGRAQCPPRSLFSPPPPPPPPMDDALPPFRESLDDGEHACQDACVCIYTYVHMNVSYVYTYIRMYVKSPRGTLQVCCTPHVPLGDEMQQVGRGLSTRGRAAMCGFTQDVWCDAISRRSSLLALLLLGSLSTAPTILLQ